MNKTNLHTLQILHKAGLLSKKESFDSEVPITEYLFSHATKLTEAELNILEKHFEADSVYRIETDEITSGTLKHHTVLAFHNVITSD